MRIAWDEFDEKSGFAWMDLALLLLRVLDTQVVGHREGSVDAICQDEGYITVCLRMSDSSWKVATLQSEPLGSE